MATFKVKMGLKGLTSEALVEKGNNCVDMCMLAAWLILPSGFLAAMRIAVDEFKQASEEVLFNGGRITYQAKRAKEVIVINFVRDLASFVQAQCGGSEARIYACGFDVCSNGTPVDQLGMPQGLRSGFTLFAGNADLRWYPLVNAINYEVWVNVGDVNDETAWTLAAITSRSRATITNLPPATVCNFRVQAIGRKGLRSPMSQTIKALVAA